MNDSTKLPVLPEVIKRFKIQLNNIGQQLGIDESALAAAVSSSNEFSSMLEALRIFILSPIFQKAFLVDGKQKNQLYISPQIIVDEGNENIVGINLRFHIFHPKLGNDTLIANVHVSKDVTVTSALGIALYDNDNGLSSCEKGQLSQFVSQMPADLRDDLIVFLLAIFRAQDVADSPKENAIALAITKEIQGIQAVALALPPPDAVIPDNVLEKLPTIFKMIDKTLGFSEGDEKSVYTSYLIFVAEHKSSDESITTNALLKFGYEEIPEGCMLISGHDENNGSFISVGFLMELVDDCGKVVNGISFNIGLVDETFIMLHTGGINIWVGLNEETSYCKPAELAYLISNQNNTAYVINALGAFAEFTGLGSAENTRRQAIRLLMNTTCD